MELRRWYVQGVIGPFADARRTFLQLLAWSSGDLDFDRVFPALARLSGEDEDAARNLKAIEWLDAFGND